MKATVVLVILTIVNVALFAHGLWREPTDGGDATRMLRGRGLEIYDEQGVLRAQLKVEPADPSYAMPGGKTGYPETVIFRLITADGKPRVKLVTSAEGSGLMLLGSSDTTRSLLKADAASTSLLLRNGEDQQRLLEP